MAAAALVTSFAIDTAVGAAADTLIGTTLAATLGSIGGAIVTGVIGGAAGGALSSAVEGGDPGMGALTGAVQGGVSEGIGAAVPTAGVTSEIQSAFPDLSAKTASSIGKGLVSGASKFAGGTAAGLVGGKKFGQALKSGAVSGIASGVASGVGDQLFGSNPSQAQTPTDNQPVGKLPPTPFSSFSTGQPVELGGVTTTLGQNAQPFNLSPTLAPDVSQFNPNLFTPSPSGADQLLNQGAQGALSRGISTGLNDVLSTGQSIGTGGGTASGGPAAGPTPTNSLNLPQVPTGVNTTNPSVSALAQALRTVPDLGYSPGGPVFGSQSTAKPKKVWNRASLRVMDEETP